MTLSEESEVVGQGPKIDGAPYGLPIAVLRVDLVAAAKIVLPPHAGSTLRGAFGHALKRTCCLYADQPCEGCVDNLMAAAEGRTPQCAYGYLFETPRPRPSAINQERGQEVPQPYVLRAAPPTFNSNGVLAPHVVYAPGDIITFEVLLFGRALNLVDRVVEACAVMARHGLGEGRGAGALSRVQERDPFGTTLRPLPPAPRREDLTLIADFAEATARVQMLPTHALTLRLLTPTQIKYQRGVVRDRPPFAALAHALLRRLTTLATFHHDGHVSRDLFAELAHLSESVQCAAWDGTWQRWDRYSSRQDSHMTFGGLVGAAVYTGDLTPYLPYLVYGQAVHIGKHCTFGDGQLSIVDGSTSAPT